MGSPYRQNPGTGGSRCQIINIPADIRKELDALPLKGPRKNAWTPLEDAIILEYASKVHMDSLAKKLKRSVIACRQRFKDLRKQRGIPVRAYNKPGARLAEV